MKQILRKLLLCERGNVALMFGLSLLPLLGMVGAAVDYSRAADQHSRLQAAVDSATLTLGKLPYTTTQAQLETQANALVKAFIKDATVRSTITTALTRTTGQIVLTANGTVSAPLVSIIGIQSVPIAATSTAKWGNSRLRVALVLDVTGSMNDDGKLGAMKTAATNLITQLQGAASQNGDVYVSIIPFAKDVNVGSGNYNETWVRWSGASDTWDEKNGDCSKSGYSTKSSCESQRACSISGYNSQNSCTNAGFCSKSGYNSENSCESQGVCSKSQYSSQNSCTSHSGTWTPATWTQGVWGYAVWTPDNHNTWNGCVMDRDQSYDTTNTTPGATSATKFPAEQYSTCPAQLMALSYDWTALKAKVNSLVAAGGTNQQIGIAWGFQSLTASPFAIPAEDPNYTYQQIIITLSDGLNTQNRFNGNGTTYTSQVDDRQAILCANIKAANIVHYTVQVNTDGDPTSDVLRACASDTGKFFMLTSASQIVTTFGLIGTALSNLRVAY